MLQYMVDQICLLIPGGEGETFIYIGIFEMNCRFYKSVIRLPRFRRDRYPAEAETEDQAEGE